MLCYAIALIGIQVLSIYMVTIHKYWCDETQIWQLAKYNNIVGLYKACKPEGHPMLYSLIVKFIQLFSNNVISLSILNTVADIVAVAILFFYIKGKAWQKILLSLGIQLCYLNAVNGRPYGLITLTIVLVFVTYQNRHEHPYRYYLQLLILQQTHIYLWQFIGILWVFGVLDTYKIIKEYGLSQKKSKDNIIGMVLYSIGIIWLLVQLAGIGQSAGSNNTLMLQSAITRYSFVDYVIIPVLTQILCPVYMIGLFSYQNICTELNMILQKYGLTLSDNISMIIMLISLSGFILLVYEINKNNTRLAIIAYAQAVGQQILSAMVIGALPNRLALTFLILGMSYIIQTYDNKVNDDKKSVIYSLGYLMLTLMSVAFNIVYVIADLEFGYGIGYIALQSIQERYSKEQTIVLIDKETTYAEAQIIQYWSGHPIVLLNDLHEYAYSDFLNDVTQVSGMQDDEIKNNANYILNNYEDVKFIFIDICEQGIPDNMQRLFYVNDITDYSESVRNLTYSEYQVYELKPKDWAARI